MRVALALSLVLVTLAGCAGRAQLAPAAGFSLPLGREHPLTGRIWSSRHGDLATRDELYTAIRGSRLLLLGETHDNADHHALQAALLDLWLGAHSEASVGFEMVDESQASALVSPYPSTPAELARKLAWADSGWPDFALYEPVFAVALTRGARLFAASPSRERVRASMHGVESTEAQTLGLDAPLPQAQKDALSQEIRDSHCGHAPEAMVAPMIAAQSFKDAWMAQEVRKARTPAALIAGRGHVRNDRAVPLFLSRRGEKDVLAIAFIEVDDRLEAAQDYEPSAYDFVIFTPRTTDTSACERFREQLARMRKAQKP